MLRLTLVLCIGMYAALMIAGEDRGQMRPGLAEAAAQKATASPEAGAEPLVATADSDAAQPGAVLAEVPAASDPAADLAPVVQSTEPVVAQAEPAEPAPYVEPQRELVTALDEPVFSLAAVGNEAPPASPQPEVLPGGEGTIWYVNARSVNVRSEPSTDAEVVGKLNSGEATLVVQAVNDDWARIVIQGDGVEGFVALRYLSAEAP